MTCFNVAEVNINCVLLQEAEKKRKVEKLKQKRWQEKHRRFIFGIHHSTDENELGEREPLIPVSGSSNDGAAYQPPTSGNMMSVSDDSEYYKENKGSMSLMQILEGLPDDKSSRASRESSKSRILSIESDEDSDGSDSAGSTGNVESYDLLKSREASRERIDSIPEEEPVVAIAIPSLPKSDDTKHDDKKLVSDHIETPARDEEPTAREHKPSGSVPDTTDLDQEPTGHGQESIAGDQIQAAVDPEAPARDAHAEETPVHDQPPQEEDREPTSYDQLPLIDDQPEQFDDQQSDDQALLLAPHAHPEDDVDDDKASTRL